MRSALSIIRRHNHELAEELVLNSLFNTLFHSDIDSDVYDAILEVIITKRSGSLGREHATDFLKFHNDDPSEIDRRLNREKNIRENGRFLKPLIFAIVNRCLESQIRYSFLFFFFF